MTIRPTLYHLRALCAYVRGVELWSVDDAARYWGVTSARARGILSSRHIGRIAGYPASDIRAVHRHQGARTDLTPPSSALSLSEAAAGIARHPDDAIRLRVFFEFMRGADEAGLAALPLITVEPPFTGDPRYDALLAAAAEHVSARHGLPAPLWTATAERFLTHAWWISDLSSARSFALVWTPAAFRRRGIYLDRHDLIHDATPFTPKPLAKSTDPPPGFAALADKLHHRNVVGQIHVIGGHAMLLAYKPGRTATRDLAAQFAPHGPVTAAIRETAHDHQWPTTWLTDQAVSYASRTPGEGARVFDHPHLHVAATPADHLLAVKTLAARTSRDAHDLRILFQHLSITRSPQVWPIIERFFPGTPIPERSRALVDVLLG